MTRPPERTRIPIQLCALSLWPRKGIESRPHQMIGVHLVFRVISSNIIITVLPLLYFLICVCFNRLMIYQTLAFGRNQDCPWRSDPSIQDQLRICPRMPPEEVDLFKNQVFKRLTGQRTRGFMGFGSGPSITSGVSLYTTYLKVVKFGQNCEICLSGLFIYKYTPYTSRWDRPPCTNTPQASWTRSKRKF